MPWREEVGLGRTRGRKDRATSRSVETFQVVSTGNG